jgi:hypothetical protein
MRGRAAGNARQHRHREHEGNHRHGYGAAGESRVKVAHLQLACLFN